MAAGFSVVVAKTSEIGAKRRPKTRKSTRRIRKTTAERLRGEWH